MDINKVAALLAADSAPKFRFAQAKTAAFTQLVSDWSQATALPPALREKLSAETPISSLELTRRTVSEKGDTVKVAFKLHDGNVIETVLMRHTAKREAEDDAASTSPSLERRTVCVSSQAGCPMRCSFCATGTMGLKRNLTAEEILDQVLFFSRELKAAGEVVTNVVLMGMGEPMHNYDNVMAALRTLNDKDGLNMGSRRMSISTCGIVAGINRLADEKMQVNLAVSLHAPNDALRQRLMPVNIAYPLGKLMPAIDEYIAKTRAKVFFEYLLIDGLNDTDEVAEELAVLMKHPLFHVNLIKYHTTGAFLSSPKAQRLRFMEILKERGVSVTHRITFGEDIDAACGQLANKEQKVASRAHFSAKP